MGHFLKISFGETEAADLIEDNYEYRNKPFANSPVYETFVKDFCLLSKGQDVKASYRLRLDIKNYNFDFLPGDVVAILPENNATEVKNLLDRLNLTEVCRLKYQLGILEGSKKSIPKHLPITSTLHDVFLKHVCIRSVAKKVFLRKLIKYTYNSKDKALLDLICSPTGSAQYIKFVESNVTLLSLLESLPSCQPPLEFILEHSLPLNPRYFSIASSPLKKELWIMFNVLERVDGLKGVCTGWLEQIIKGKQFSKTVPIYFKKPGKFRLENANAPIIMVATGSGLAPFLGFLEHKYLVNSVSDTWLFYGCRYFERDFLCEEDLAHYENKGTLTKICLAFSRGAEKKRYVQDKIMIDKIEFARWIFEKEAIIFLCGYLIKALRDVKDAIVKCIMNYKKCDKSAAFLILEELVKCDKIIIDSWV